MPICTFVLIDPFEISKGVIHVISHPLLPPPSIFQELFMAPQVFSTLVCIMLLFHLHILRSD